MLQGLMCMWRKYFIDNYVKVLYLIIFLSVLPQFLSARADSVQIFYEEHNSILTVSVQDYVNELNTQLGEKGKSYAGHLDTLLNEAKGQTLFLRRGFWSAAKVYERIDLPLLEQTPLVLFVTGKAVITQRGKRFKFEDIDTKEKEFHVCNDKKGPVAGVMVWVIAKKENSLLITVPKSVTDAFINTGWCR